MLAIVLAFGVFLIAGLLVIPAVELGQQAEAAGCPSTGPAVNASKGRCFHG
jgi:hypothetical protein